MVGDDGYADVDVHGFHGVLMATFVGLVSEMIMAMAMVMVTVTVILRRPRGCCYIVYDGGSARFDGD